MTLANINISITSQPQCSDTHRAGGRYQFLHFSLGGVGTQRPQDLANLRDLEGMKYEMFER